VAFSPLAFTALLLSCTSKLFPKIMLLYFTINGAAVITRRHFKLFIHTGNQTKRKKPAKSKTY
jgi:hypothetical protein